MQTKFFKLLLVQLFILSIAVLKLINPSLSFASELIGTHLGEGDVGYQVGIIQSVLIPNGLEAGSPVTVMVPVTAFQGDPNNPGSQANSLKKLSDVINLGGYFPIIRINEVCKDFSNETKLNAQATITLARNIFGPEALIIWGNEINNQDDDIKGCTNWKKYYSDYSTIKDLPNVSPAALDYYMGNAAYTVTAMFADTPELKPFFNTNNRAANAYGCTTDSKASCNPAENAESCNAGGCTSAPTQTQIIGYGEVGSPFYLTEFSLSPMSNSPDAPDTEIPKVLDFIKLRAPETGATKITPLVRNVCNNESDWLLYINGKLFTPLGTQVDENCEGTTSGSGYDVSIYPDYDVDETKSYITPIRNVIDGPSTEYSISKLREELATQGYQAYCASEGVKIEPKYNTAELISKYFKLVEKGMPEVSLEDRTLELEATETLSTVNAKYPLWRDVSGKQFLMSSLEEYFGFKDVYEPSPSRSVLSSSPINSLLSEPQMCVQGWKNIVAQRLACDRLENPGDCELLTRPIPDTDLTVMTLSDKLNEFDPMYREGTEIQGCRDLVAGADAPPDLFKGLINTPTYFDRAYRYGFIVAVIHTKNPNLAETNLAMKIFNFFTETTKLQEPKDEVLVAAFKLPDIGTNHWEDEANGVQFWDDALSLTRLVLSTNQKNKLHEANGTNEDPENKIKGRNEKQADILNGAVSVASQTEDNKIFCTTATENSDGQLTGGETTTSCQNNLTKAITDIINGNSEGCGDTEAVNIIKDIAGLDNPEEDYGRVFNGDNGLEVILNLFKGDKTHPSAGSEDQTDPQQAATKDPAEKLQSIFNITKENWSSRDDTPATVDFYVVYPMGFELEAVETAMKGAFFTKAQLALLEEQQDIDGFEMTGIAMGLSSSSDGFTYEDVEKTAAGACGTTENTVFCRELCIAEGNTPPECAGLPLCSGVTETVNNKCMENPSATIKQEGSGVGILGAKLGFWMREVQKQLSSKTSSAWNYFDSCETTEEFMLGQCKGSL